MVLVPIGGKKAKLSLKKTPSELSAVSAFTPKSSVKRFRKERKILLQHPKKHQFSTQTGQRCTNHSQFRSAGLRPFQGERRWGLWDARGDEMAPAHLAGYLSPTQEKGAEPPAGKDGTRLGRPGVEIFARSQPHISGGKDQRTGLGGWIKIALMVKNKMETRVFKRTKRIVEKPIF